MSRRDSRVSLNIRQNDALNEFENFKKKFLLANKHITKLNSTLNVRIDALNAQISSLYVENLSLRASEIALNAQLKKEREKSKKILSDTETATRSLTKHLHFLRQSLNIPPGTPSPPSVPPPAKARRPVIDPNIEPSMPRLSRAPTVPGINEDDEFPTSAETDEDDADPPSVHSTKRKTKTRLSASRLPLPARVASPPPLPAPLHINLQEHLAASGRKKPSRRRSGFLAVLGDDPGEDNMTLIPLRPCSPMFGSSAHGGRGFAEEKEDMLAVHDMLMDGDEDDDALQRKEEENEAKQVEVEASDGERVRERERKRRREEEPTRPVEGSKSKLNDVTDSPHSHTFLPPLDTNTSDRDRQPTPETDGPTPISATTSSATTRTFLSTPTTTPATTPQIPYLLTPRSSISPAPPPISTSEAEAANGRERRTRKSINYTEPKLNTKMRKPDSSSAPANSTSSKKRSSTASHSEDPEPRSSLEAPPPFKLPSSITRTSSSSSSGGTSSTVKRIKSRSQVFVEEDESDGAQADAEYGGVLNGRVTVDGRRQSTKHHPRDIEADDEMRHSMAA